MCQPYLLSVHLSIGRFNRLVGRLQEIAHKRSGSIYFTTPEVLVAGEPAVLYVNRSRLLGLVHTPTLRVHFGFNSWQTGSQEVCMKPTSLLRGEHVDW